MDALGNFIFAMAQWLRTTPLNKFSIWLSNTPASMVVQTHFWFIPIVQTIHILAISAAFGSVLMINLRILGLIGGYRTMSETARRFLPWVWWALLTLLITGLFMVLGEPIRELINPVFWMKMVMVIFAVLISIWFQSSVRKNIAWWELTQERRVLVRIGSVCVICLWLVIMLAGRWIAYAPV